MLTNKTALGALAIAGVVAAGSGAYFATRQQPIPERQPASASQDIALPTDASAVTETENSLSPAPSAPEVNEPVEPPRAVSAPVSQPRTASMARPRAAQPPAAPVPPPAAAVEASVPENPPVAAAIEPVESTSVERRPAVPEPPQKRYEDLVVAADSVIGLQIETTVTSAQAKVEDPVKARVSRDVKVRDRVAIPAGSRAEGSITLVEKGGRLKDQARLGIRFHTIVLADGTRLPITTDTIYREGDSPAGESAAKIGGGAVGGAVLGAIFGGKKGAIIGSTVGAGAGSAAVMASSPDAATLPAGSTVTVRMSAPATVTVEE